MKFTPCSFILTALLLGLAVPSAQACRSAGLHTYTFFEELRPSLVEALFASERVAKVKILDTEVGSTARARITTVQVTHPIRGLRRGDILVVLSSLSSCEQDTGLAAGRRFFIAGAFDRGRFIGTWKFEDGAVRRVEPFVPKPIPEPSSDRL